MPKTITPVILEGHTAHVNRALFAPDGEALYSLGFNGELFEWDPRDWSPRRSLPGHDQSVNALDFSSDGKTMYSGGTDGRLIIWDRKTGEPTEVIEEFKKGVHQVQVLPASRLLALSTPREEIVLYHLEEKRPIQAFAPRGKRKGLFAIGPRESRAAIAEFSGNLLLVSLPELRVQQEIKVSEEAIMGCLFLTEERLITVDYKGTLQLWDLDEEEAVETVDLKDKDYYFLSLSFDKNRLALSHSHHLRIYDASTLEEQTVLELKPKGNYGSGFSPDGRWLALGSADKKVRVWEVERLRNF